MRQTLFYLPETIAGIPLFGIGWSLGLLVLIIFVAQVRASVAGTLRQTLLRWGPTWVLAAFLIVGVLPYIERMPAVAPSDSLPGHGLPIRGYGVMLVVAAVASVALAARRSVQRGIPAEQIFDLSFSFFVCGILGARTAFILQHWRDYSFRTPLDFLLQFVNIAEGGLVVYGSLFGAAIAVVLFAWRRRLPLLVLGDVLTPCLLLGLALGRIGCFLNGCCWGGPSHAPWSVCFPPGSPPYVSQLREGRFWGFTLAEAGQQLVIRDVAPQGPADRAGLRAGEVVVAVNGQALSTSGGALDSRLARAGDLLQVSGRTLQISRGSGPSVTVALDQLPTRAFPLHPTQLYSTIDALILLLLLLAYEPFARRDGELVVLGFGLYAISRFLMEMIRDDEMGLWGSPWTFSQWSSIAIGLAAAGLGAYLAAKPAGKWPAAELFSAAAHPTR